MLFIAKAFKNPKTINRLRFFWKVQVMKAFHPHVVGKIDAM